MIKPLRKNHYIVWRILAFVLPVLFIFAFMYRPEKPAPVEYAALNFSFFQSADSALWVNVTAVDYRHEGSVVLYQVLEGQHKVLLGMINPLTNNSFKLSDNLILNGKTTFELSDVLHMKTLNRFEQTIDLNSKTE